jgi:hypothetical protein
MDLVGSLRRRWILVAVLFALTLAATALALFKLPWTYQSQSAVVLLPSKSMSKADGGNPYLAFNSTLNQTGDVIRYEVTDLGTKADLVAHGYPESYTIIDATDTSGPILVITVTGSNKAAVEHTLYGVTQQVGTELNAQQAGISSADAIRDQVITFTPYATRLTSKKSRPLSVVFGLGLALTIGVPLMIDAAMVRRRTSRQTSYWPLNGQQDNWTAVRRAETGRNPEPASTRFPEPAVTKFSGAVPSKFSGAVPSKFTEAGPDVTMPLSIRSGFDQINSDKEQQAIPNKGNLSESQGDSGGS